MKYKIALYQTDEGFSVSAPGLPGCWSQGGTEVEALANIEAAIQEYLSVVDELLGLFPQPDGSIANWLTQREAMRDLVRNGPEMMALFEDDARLTPDLPEVLAVLEQKRFAFDVLSCCREGTRSAVSSRP